MKPMVFSIRASKEKVWNTMLQQDTYRIWASEFMAGSYYEGSWEQGQEIRFLGPDGSGITSLIAENDPYRYISIKHLGIVKNRIDDTESPEARQWSHAYENYAFAERDGITDLQVELSGFPAEFEQEMADIWPRAIARLQSLCE